MTTRASLDSLDKLRTPDVALERQGRRNQYAARDREEWSKRANEIRARLDVSVVVGRVVTLKKAGNASEHIGLCPFHNEATPSFTVSDKKKFAHCFGCGWHGDVIAFVMERQKLEFREAVEVLESRHGLAHLKAARPVPPAPKARQREDLDKAQRVLRMWNDARPIAKDDPVDRYLRGRGLLPLADWIGGELADWCATHYRDNAGWSTDLRFAPSCWHGLEKRHLPAMIAAQRRAGVLTSVHRTYLQVTGVGVGKAGTRRDKAMYGDPNGTLILLGPVTDRMGGGEGIETSHSAGQMAGRVPLAFASRASMAKTAPPFECSDFVYWADLNKWHPEPSRSRVGEAAAWAGARANGAGRCVSVSVPDLGAGELGDFNDLLMLRLGLKDRESVKREEPPAAPAKPAPVIDRESVDAERQAKLSAARDVRNAAKVRFRRARRAVDRPRKGATQEQIDAARAELREAGQAFQAALLEVDRLSKVRRRVA